MKKTVMLILLLATGYTYAQTALYSVDAFSGSAINTINPTTGAIINTVDMSLTGFTISGSNGLALNPSSNELYVLLQTNGGETTDPRILGIVNPATGIVTQVGDTGDAFSAITFAPDGTLYGVTGDGASTTSTLYSINTADASTTFLLGLTSNGDGQIIGFNPNDGLIYELDRENLYSINPNTLVETFILSLDDIAEPTSIQYDPSSGGFLVADLNNDFYSVSIAGDDNLLGTMSNTSKGLAFFAAIPLMIPSITNLGIVILAFGLLLLSMSQRKRFLK